MFLKELGMAPVTAFRWLQEFIENAVMTDNEPDFPRKLLLFYNKGLPDNEEGLGKSDVDQLRGYVEDIMKEIYLFLSVWFVFVNNSCLFIL